MTTKGPNNKTTLWLSSQNVNVTIRKWHINKQLETIKVPINVYNVSTDSVQQYSTYKRKADLFGARQFCLGIVIYVKLLRVGID